MSLLLALVCGVLAYFVASLVFNQVISVLIGVVVALSVAFDWRTGSWRR